MRIREDANPGSCRDCERLIRSFVLESIRTLAYYRGMATVASNLPILSPQEAADELGVSLSRVHQFCQKNRLGQRVGGVWIISREELDEFKRTPRYPGKPRENAGKVEK